MKKKIFLIAFLTTVTGNVSAQLTVYSNGNVGMGTSSATDVISTLSINQGQTGYDLAVRGKSRGIHGESRGNYLSWSYGLYGASYCPSTNFQTGVAGHAVISTPQSSGRTYGVRGLAGNATNGWNYAIYGELNGKNNGAGVYGTSVHAENGTCLDARYAGYFNGLTKVNGDLKVSGAITGMILGPSSEHSSVSALSEYNNSNIVSDKLATLSPTCYYTESATANANAITSSADTSTVVPTACEIETLSAERVHYGIDVNTLRETFPELVYEQENGTVAVNYMELIPILVQAINELRTEVKVLKANGNNTRANGTNASSTVINLSTDGRSIWTKKVENTK